ncbi:MAG: glycosyltransferase family 39 protein [Acidobacteria bacterium]|nr:glycosyltransferase family 39 protein [Acidobacteriota bacterium]MBI3656227.1 glycosyltransferase family 39 protein [Acidobacteriota bacterium]
MATTNRGLFDTKRIDFLKAHPQLIALLICTIYLIVILIVSSYHKIGTYGTETDFYGQHTHFMKSLFEKPEGPTQHGPGYPFVLWLITFVDKDVFHAGKMLSIVSSVLLAFFAFKFLRNIFDSRLALLALLIMLLNPTFVEYSIAATTDMFFMFLFILMLYLLLCEPTTYVTILLSGIVGGVAFMTRTAAIYFPIAVGVCLLAINYTQKSLKERTALLLVFLSVFLVTASPWLISNYRHFGNPLANSGYNITASTYFGEGPSAEGWGAAAQRFNSIFDVVAYNPSQFVKLYLINIAVDFVKSIIYLFPIGIAPFLTFGGLVLLLNFRRHFTRTKLSVLIFVAFLFLFQALLQWDNRFFLILVPLYSLVISYGIVFLQAKLEKSRGILISSLGSLAIIIVVLLIFLVNTVRATKDFIAAEPRALIAAAKFLESIGKPSDILMARKPHLGFISNLQNSFFPDAKNLDELFEIVKANHITYVLYSEMEEYYRPQFEALSDPKNAPVWLMPIYLDKNTHLVIYKVVHNPLRE